jgi:hypothetical protein
VEEAWEPVEEVEDEFVVCPRYPIARPDSKVAFSLEILSSWACSWSGVGC